MYSSDKHRISISINLEPGIYQFEDESATGKTRLYYLLRDLQLMGEPVISFSYEDLQLGMDLEKQLSKCKYKVIMLDRYDLYKDYCKDLLPTLCEAIILIDCKSFLSFTEYYNTCVISMTESKVEVREW